MKNMLRDIIHLFKPHFKKQHEFYNEDSGQWHSTSKNEVTATGLTLKEARKNVRSRERANKKW